MFLKLRVNMMIIDKTLKDLKFALETGLGNERIRVGGVSFFGDRFLRLERSLII